MRPSGTAEATKTVRVQWPPTAYGMPPNSCYERLKRSKTSRGGVRMPDWYLRFALANVCIFSLREFAKELPKLLDDFLKPTSTGLSPEVIAMTGSQALQAIVKVQLIADALPQAAENFEALRMGNDRHKN